MKRYASFFLIALLSSSPAYCKSKNRQLSQALPGAPPAVRVGPLVPHRSQASLVGVSYPSTHYQRALYFKQHGDLNHALVEFLKTTQENPRLISAFYEQALIFRERGYLKLAESSLEQALAVKPDYQKARLLLATLQLQQGNVSGALGELSRSLGLPTNNPSTGNQSPLSATEKPAAPSAGFIGRSSDAAALPPADSGITIDPGPAVMRLSPSQTSDTTAGASLAAPLRIDSLNPGAPSIPARPAGAPAEKITGIAAIDELLKGIPGVDPAVPVTPPVQQPIPSIATPALPPVDYGAKPGEAAGNLKKNPETQTPESHPRFRFSLPRVPNLNPFGWFARDNSQNTPKEAENKPQPSAEANKEQPQSWLDELFDYKNPTLEKTGATASEPAGSLAVSSSKERKLKDKRGALALKQQKIHEQELIATANKEQKLKARQQAAAEKQQKIHEQELIAAANKEQKLKARQQAAAEKQQKIHEQELIAAANKEQKLKARQQAAAEKQQKIHEQELIAAANKEQKLKARQQAAAEKQQKIHEQELIAAANKEQKLKARQQAAAEKQQKIHEQELIAAANKEQKLKARQQAAAEKQQKIHEQELIAAANKKQQLKQKDQLAADRQDRRSRHRQSGSILDDDTIPMIVSQPGTNETALFQPLPEQKPVAPVTGQASLAIPGPNPVPAQPPADLQSKAFAAVTRVFNQWSQALFMPDSNKSASAPLPAPKPHELPARTQLNQPAPAASPLRPSSITRQPTVPPVAQLAPPVAGKPQPSNELFLPSNSPPAVPISTTNSGPRPLSAPSLPQAASIYPCENIIARGTQVAPHVTATTIANPRSQAPQPVSLASVRTLPVFPSAVSARPLARAVAPVKPVLGRPAPAATPGSRNKFEPAPAPKPTSVSKHMDQSIQTTLLAPRLLKNQRPASPAPSPTRLGFQGPMPVPQAASNTPAQVNIEPATNLVSTAQKPLPQLQYSPGALTRLGATSPSPRKSERIAPTFPSAVARAPAIIAHQPTMPALGRPQPAVTPPNNKQSAILPRPWYQGIVQSLPPLPRLTPAAPPPVKQIEPQARNPVHPTGTTPSPRQLKNLPQTVNLEPSENLVVAPTSAQPQISPAKYARLKYAPAPLPSNIKTARFQPVFPGAVAPPGQPVVATAIPPAPLVTPPPAIHTAHRGFVALKPRRDDSIKTQAAPAGVQMRTVTQPAHEPPAAGQVTGDPWTVRLKYLAENGTGSLKDGETFMFSEETGEATLFLQSGQCIRRRIAAPRDPVEVVQQRRPDISMPKELMYNLSLLGKLLPHNQPAPNNSQQSSPFSIDNLNLDKQDGVWGWLKQQFKF